MKYKPEQALSCCDKNPLLTRDDFRESTFKRDNYTCVFCDKPAVDAHHIMERRLFDRCKGYHIDNGASVCEEHHLACEKTLITVEQVREACGITKIIVPDQLYDDHIYDKWGNICLDNGTRSPGELFYDESVQKILNAGGVLGDFTPYWKYQRTYHMPWSPGIHSDDRLLQDMSSFEGEEVILTLKMDGECLPTTAKIHLADGKIKTIGNIVSNNLIGLEVLGLNSDGKLIPTKITRVYNNGTRTEPWMRLQFVGQTGKLQYLVCTKNHEIKTGSGYTTAQHLQIGDTVTTYVPEVKISHVQREVVLGKLLGDGSLHIQRRRSALPSNSALMQYSHKAEHEEYVEWTNLWLGDLFSNQCIDNAPRYGNVSMIKAWTKQSTDLFASFGQMVLNSPKKIICRDLVEIASPLTIAFWYMDDGALSHTPGQQDRGIISVCNFDDDSIEVLREMLAKFEIQSSRYQYDGYEYLYLSNGALRTLSSLIWQYVPPCMQYKLATEYRNRVPINPFDSIKCEYGYKSVDTKIVKIDPEWETRYTGKYDIETELHNYVADGIVVHNCTTMYPDYIHARSIDGRSHPSRDWVKRFWSQIAYQIPPNMRICGENVYAEHSIKYNDLESYFYGFQMWHRDECLSWDDTLEYFALLNVQPVTVLYRGIYDEATIKQIQSKLDYNTNEGTVLRVTRSFRYKEFKSAVCKHVRKGHVQTGKHWMHGQAVIPNKLKGKE